MARCIRRVGFVVVAALVLLCSVVFATLDLDNDYVNRDAVTAPNITVFAPSDLTPGGDAIIDPQASQVGIRITRWTAWHALC